MTIRNLDYLFDPKSVALIGASRKPGSVGAVLVENLTRAGFKGPIMPVHPTEQAIGGILTYKDVAALPLVPDLAVICVPAPLVPKIARQLGERGCKAAVVISAGFGELPGEKGKALQAELLKISGEFMMRIIGPNCLGMILPHINLNASFAHRTAQKGGLAFISQSGALCTSVLDWAGGRDIGFSYFISMGNRMDVDFGDMLDYLALDDKASAILLYIESIKTPRKFISALRAAARNKPVIIVKSGRFAEGAQAALSHTGALAGADDVYEAAFKRAGALRVGGLEDLFDAAETLSRGGQWGRGERAGVHIEGERLSIVSNGGGAGVLATDALIERHGKLAELSEETIARLDKVLPSLWSRGNPVDIIGDAGGKRYEETMKIMCDAPEVDGVLVMHCPTAVTSPVECAEAVSRVFMRGDQEGSGKFCHKPVLTSWLGGPGVAAARRVFEQDGIPTYDSPERGVTAFQYMVQYRQNQKLLRETAASTLRESKPDKELAQGVIKKALDEGRSVLSEPEAKQILSAYQIRTVKTIIVKSADEAIAAAETIGFPVVLKILSPDISHKSDVGGVMLDITTVEGLTGAVEAMQRRIKEALPKARIEGYTVQEMVPVDGSYELIVGVYTDHQFGPVILFGEGGTGVEVIRDKAIGLPPLNRQLARRIIEQTRIYNLLKGYRDQPAVDFEKLYDSLVNVSQMVIDLPEIAELDINPLLCDAGKVIALDARFKILRVEHEGKCGADRLAIRPYPSELEDVLTVEDGTRYPLRPIKPEDAGRFRTFVGKLDAEDRYLRFFNNFKQLSPSLLGRLTQLDYDREMEFVLFSGEGGEAEIIGSVGSFSLPGGEEAEFAMMVSSDYQGLGLGHQLMGRMIEYTKKRGVRRLYCHVLDENVRFVDVAKDFGFKVVSRDADVVRLELELLN